jgi:environmental stress-induced protein Ves
MADLRLIRSADLVRVPWKDGGGTTAEVAVHPPGAGFDDFDWRISMADVAADGPFSRFPGVDRTLVLAEGRDLVLDIEGDIQVLIRPGDARSFAGEVAAGARLHGGPVRDINVMSRRGRFAHRVGSPATGEPLRSWAAMAVVAIAALAEGVMVTVEGRSFGLAPLDLLLAEGGLRDPGRHRAGTVDRFHRGKGVRDRGRQHRAEERPNRFRRYPTPSRPRPRLNRAHVAVLS